MRSVPGAAPSLESRRGGRPGPGGGGRGWRPGCRPPPRPEPGFPGAHHSTPRAGGEADGDTEHIIGT
jgi:hypothetical protein